MRPPRRAYLDWLRGVAVLCMIEWHVLDAWTAFASRNTWVWAVIQFIGGLAAPLFLFLAGVAVPLAIAGHSSRGAAPRRAAWLVQKRGWEVFAIAHLFRFQSFLLNPNAKWSGLLKPDILNVLGLGLAGTAWLTGRAEAARDGGASSRVRRILWLLVPVVIVLVLTPGARRWWWPTLLHPRLEAYIRPSPFGVFQLFPWVAYVPFGAFIGLLIADPKDEHGERRLHWQLFLYGGAACLIGYVIDAVRFPPAIAAGMAVWGRFFRFGGGMTAGIGAAWAWMRRPVADATAGPLLLFGRTSLFVYWVHVELAYGVLSYPLHYALPLYWSIPGFAAMTTAMYFAAGWWANRKGPWIPQQLRAASSRVQSPASRVLGSSDGARA